MKLKVILLSVACSLGVYASYACSYAECGGGKAQCCRDVFGAIYYCKATTGTGGGGSSEGGGQCNECMAEY